MGRKKQKKKIYSKPKKIKHKHKKQKLAVLKYYNVDDAGKLRRLRLECPNVECGAGHFMADHFDRVHCGRCGLTYKKREWDWRPYGILNPIRQQGNGNCCFAFATCAAIEALHHIKTGKRGDDRIVLSPQDLYTNLITNDTQDRRGRTIPDTLSWIRDNGCVLEKDCPYQERYNIISHEGHRKVKLRIETTKPLQLDEEIMEEVMEAPVPAEMYWIEEDMKYFRGDGIYYTPKDPSLMKESNMHGVLIVGFGEHLGKKGKFTKFWIVRNSHGSIWGEEGYGKIERSLVTAAWAIRGIALEDVNGVPFEQ